MSSATSHASAPAPPGDVSILFGFLRRFWRHRLRLAGGFVCVPIGAWIEIEITLVVGNALDRLRAADDVAFLRGLFWILLALALVRGVVRFLQRWWIVVVSRYVEVELKQELFDKLCTLSFGFFSRRHSGDIASRLTSDVENLRMFLGPGLMYVAGAATMLPVSVATLLGMDPWLTLALMVPLALMGAGMWLLTPRLHRHSTAVQESAAAIAARAQESLGGVRVVRGFGVERAQARRFRATSLENLGHQVELARARGLTHAITYGAHDLSFLPILFLGGLAIIDRSLVVGDLFVFVDLTIKVFWPVIALGWMAGMYPRALASARRVREILEERPEIADPPRPRALAGAAPIAPSGAANGAAPMGSGNGAAERPPAALRLANVSFSYHGAESPALSGVSVEVAPGGMLGIVGPTGSGKTTLLYLVGRLLEAPAGSGGTIELDGVPIRELALAELRRQLAYVPQDGFLFSEPYADNVAFGADRPLARAEIERLIGEVAMTEEVAGFPRGLDTPIGERGVTLSGGQRQRTCIARALARDPRVLVLDDCLSAVDTETEARLLAALRRAAVGRTLLVAAHRLSTVRDADLILVLGRGRVEALGTHAELLERSPWYRETWARQQAQEELAGL